MAHNKELYTVKSIHEAFYTGGNIEILKDGSRLFCQCKSSIQIMDVESGRACDYIGDLPSDENESELDTIITFKLSEDNSCIISSHKSNLLKLWNLGEGNKLLKHWKAIHKGPVVKLALSSNNIVLATGGTDSSIRLWDMVHNSCTHNLTECQGVVSVLKFLEKDDNLYLFGASDDNEIRCWDCSTGDQVLSLNGHFSKVTCLDFHPDNKYIVSCSRDKVLILWDAKSGKQIKVIPLYESVESLVVLPERIYIPGQDLKVEGGFYVATGGDKGVVRFWDVESASELFVQTNSLVSKANDDQALAITHLHYSKSLSAIFVTSVEHNIIVHDLNTFLCKKQLIGFSDEILSTVLVGKEEDYLAVATNSNDIKLYNLATMSCQILRGHTGFVLSLSSTPAYPNIFASASKDCSIRVWMLVEDTAVCVMIGTRHTDTVHAVALPTTSCKFAVSVSQDTTLKLWNLPKKISAKKFTGEPEILPVKQTVIAHEKEINDVCISPNDKIVATASFDKTAKLWNSDDLTPLGTLKGHRRGVWCCKFSPVDQVLLTSSADATLKLWSIADLSCLKTFEGHDSSVLQACFLTRGTQLISAGGDGLLKLWSIKTGECVASFDNHNGKIWSLVVSQNEETMYSGGTDSRLVIWQDWSEQSREERIKASHEKALCDQRLANLIQSKDLLNAIRYALSLNRPATVLKIIQDLVNEGEIGLEDTITQLKEADKIALLNYAAHWNTNSKRCFIAQVIISMLLPDISNGSLKPPQSVLEAIIPYTDRHFKRLTQLLQDLHFIKFAKRQINPLTS